MGEQEASITLSPANRVIETCLGPIKNAGDEELLFFSQCQMSGS